MPFSVSSERTIVELDAKKEAKKLERWRKIVKEAAEQSHRAVLPEICRLRRFDKRSRRPPVTRSV